MTGFETFLLFVGVTFVTWQLMYFFCFEEGRVQRRRQYNAVKNIHKYGSDKIAEDSKRSTLAFNYKKKHFEIDIVEEKVNYHYKYYHIFINGAEAAKYHRLKHCFINSYELETLNRRWSSEVIELIHAGNKHLKRLNRELNKNSVPDWKEHSYFN